MKKLNYVTSKLWRFQKHRKEGVQILFDDLLTIM